MNLTKNSIKVFILTGTFSLLSFTVSGQSQKTVKSVSKHSTTHKNLLASQGDIKKEINLVDSLMLSYSLENESKSGNPAAHLYGDDWSTERVNPYRNMDIKLPDSLVIDCSQYCIPVPGSYITSNFGPRGRRMHYGTDLKVQVGDTIYAAFSGKIRMCNYERKGYGYYVVMRHHNGFETVYGHLSDFLVTEGQNIKVGEPIALGGNTGRSTGPHLHFEVRVKGQPINPTEIFDFKNEVTHMDTYVFNGRKIEQDRKKAEKYTKGSVKYYTVRKGDTLSKIARKHGLSLAKLCKINNISAKKAVRAGQRLRCS